MKNFDGIIFDVDGTLASTNELIFSSFNFIFEKYLNKTLTPEEIVSYFGPTENQIIEKLFEDPEKVKKDYYKFYSDNHHIVDLYAGIKEILEMCKEKNILLSIYTGKGRDAASITLKKLFIYDYFDLIITGDEVKEHKPSPEGVTLFLEKFNLNKERVLMIGDAPSDVTAAHGAGIKVASVLWDSYAKEKVLQMKSDFIFYSVEELKKFISENI